MTPDDLDDTVSRDLPGPADDSQRAVLAACRAILTGAGPDAIHDAAGSASCDVCSVVSAAQWSIALAAQLAGDGPFPSGRLRRVLLAAVEAAERELGAAPN